MPQPRTSGTLSRHLMSAIGLLTRRTNISSKGLDCSSNRPSFTMRRMRSVAVEQCREEQRVFFFAAMRRRGHREVTPRETKEKLSDALASRQFCFTSAEAGHAAQVASGPSSAILAGENNSITAAIRSTKPAERNAVLPGQEIGRAGCCRACRMMAGNSFQARKASRRSANA
jgi:hypothetical protein